MIRTQISLTLEERTVLDAESARTGKSLSALIRDAVEKVYGSSRNGADELVILNQTFGAWPDRSEDGATVVERLRSGSRLKATE